MPKAQCWKSVSGGYAHSAGIKEDGTLWTWGDNKYGQLGNGTVLTELYPTQVGTETNWAKVSCGGLFVVAMKNDGSIWSWGWNATGELGLGTTTDSITIPTQIGTSTNWVDVAAGWAHVLALDGNGSIWSWGYNSFGSLGNGTTTSTNSPALLSLVSDWEYIVAGSDHSLGIRGQGLLLSWGRGDVGQLGIGSTPFWMVNPQEISSDTWFEVNAGNSHCASLKYAGPQQATLWTWGQNNKGQLGDGTNTDKNTPIQIGIGDDWAKLQCNYSSTYAIKADGSLWSWGENDGGQLGSSSFDLNTPAQVGNANIWQDIYSVKGKYMLATKTDGSLWAWGKNDDGQLGNGTTSNSNIPVLIMSCLLGLEDNGIQNVSIFPNPATDWLQLKGTQDIEIQELYITDIKGQQVAFAKENADRINIEHLNAGIYFIHIATQSSFIQLKFVKI